MSGNLNQQLTESSLQEILGSMLTPVPVKSDKSLLSEAPAPSDSSVDVSDQEKSQ